MRTIATDSSGNVLHALCDDWRIIENMITSTSNGKVKHVVNLLQKSKYRKENNSFVVEGIKMVSEADDKDILDIFVSESYSKSDKFKNECFKFDKNKIEVVADNVFKQMSDTKTPQGILAVVKMKETNVTEIIGKENAFVMVCEDVQDPGNLGTIIRTGEGAGITGVILTKNTVDVYNPKTIRSTMGSLYRVPFVYVDDIEETIANMKVLGIKVYATHLNGNNNYTKENYTDKCAFLIGNEGNGLKDSTAKCADTLVKVPMEGSVESLNAAICAAVVMYEVNRQRGE